MLRSRLRVGEEPARKPSVNFREPPNFIHQTGSTQADDFLLHWRGADRCVRQDFHRSELRFAGILK